MSSDVDATPERGDLPAIVLPSRDDPLVATGSGGVGGPAGRLVAPDSGWWTAVRIVLAMVLLTFGLGLVLKQPCRADAWSEGDQYTHMCYSDIGFLYRDRGLAEGRSPYDATAPDDQLEYPVLTGGFMYLTARIVGDEGTTLDRMRRFYDVTAIGLLIAAMVVVWATARTHFRRPWDAAMVALSPGILLAATINWDLIAVALSALALWAWSRSKPLLTGALLGLAIAAKFYPLFLLGPLFLLCLRAGKLREFGRTVIATLAFWIAVNVPVWLVWPNGWERFYRFSSERSWDYGSFWYALDLRGYPVPRESLNTIAGLAFGIGCLGIAALALYAKRRPRLPQLAFLVVAAFLVTNKVYSPQFVLWLIPLAVLARPRWRDFLIWQSCEVVYFASAWWFLQSLNHPDRALNADWYSAAILVHIAGTLFFAVMVVRDVLNPGTDPIRAEGPDIDDPAGGILDHAPDRFTLRPKTPYAPVGDESSDVADDADTGSSREVPTGV